MLCAKCHGLYEEGADHCPRCRQPLRERAKRPKLLARIIQGAVLLLVLGTLWYLYNPGGYFARVRVLKAVKSYQLLINDPSGVQRTATLESLIRSFDPATRTLSAGKTSPGVTQHTAAQPKPWSAVYRHRQWYVTAHGNGNSYLFATDQGEVSPVDHHAQWLFDLCGG